MSFTHYGIGPFFCANVCRHFTSEVLSHVWFTASWYRSFWAIHVRFSIITWNNMCHARHHGTELFWAISVWSSIIKWNNLCHTQRLLHTNAFTRRCFYTHTHFHTQTLLHTDAFTHRGFYTQTLLHTDTFTHRHFYPQKLLHTHTHTRFSFTHTHTFTHRGFYTQTLTQRLLHTEAFTPTHTYTHLLRNILSNYCCGMHHTCKNNSFKSDRHVWMIGSEKLCEGNLSTSLLEGSSSSDAARYNCSIWRCRQQFGFKKVRKTTCRYLA